MDDVYVYLIDSLPPGVHEFVTPCADGYTVYIDIAMDEQHRLDAYNHALEHIRRGDFDADATVTVQEIELAAHGVEPPASQEDLKERIEVTKKRRPSRAWVRYHKRMQALADSGYDFFAAAERRWLEP